MRRSSGWICRMGLVMLFAGAGCNGPDGHRWTMPWQKPMAKEDYQVPPIADARYSEPATLPKSALRPGVKPKPDNEQQARFQGGGMGGGGFGAGRPGAMGGY